MKRYEKNLTEGAIVPQIITYAIPIILTSLVQLTYNAADLIVVGQFGMEGSVGAVGTTGSITYLIITLLVGLSTGACSVIAKHIGAGEREAANKAAHTAITVALFGGISIGILGFCVARPLLEMMNAPGEMIDRSVVYMKIYFMGLPAGMLYNFGASAMRAMGDTRRPLLFSMTSGAANVVFNLITVIVFRMDVAGVAIATVASQVISASLVMRALFVGDSVCKLSLSKMRIDREELRSIFKIGIPSGLQATLFSISNVFLQSSVNSFGQYATDGSSASGSLEGYIFIAVGAFSQATLVFVSQNYGARKFERVKHAVAISCVIAALSTTFIGGVMLIFKQELFSLYLGNSTDSIAYGIQRANILFLTHAFCGMMDILSSALVGLGRVMYATVTTLIGVCALRVIWLLTVFEAFRTFACIFLSYPITWIITSSALAIMFVFAYKKEKTKAMSRA